MSDGNKISEIPVGTNASIGGSRLIRISKIFALHVLTLIHYSKP